MKTTSKRRSRKATLTLIATPTPEQVVAAERRAYEAVLKWWGAAMVQLEIITSDAQRVAKRAADPESPLYQLVDGAEMESWAGELADVAVQLNNLVPWYRLELPDPLAGLDAEAPQEGGESSP